ncbi:MAG: thioredoxin-dependent thiol peroxidase [Flavobacteriales bacterium]|jgi:peroxiredoxin Q/BCP|nr:thioredoxin-dependent thiol peroxidase [Flavobacteriales bacterium]|tara:strand:+ start:301 stop:768 length:468 start_codon:yes stop_codon:yes gene_type:complete
MTHLKEGDVAPNFTGLNQDSNSVSLSDYKGKKIILYFYPKDNTPGCTAQSCNLTDNYSDLLNNGFDVLGVSPDSVKSHLNFITKFNLVFDLIADEDRSICLLYGVFGKKKFMGREYDGVYRTTFIINENQIIEKVFTKVNTKNHAEQILESYKKQ